MLYKKILIWFMCITISGRNSASALCFLHDYPLYYDIYIIYMWDMRKKGVKRSQQKIVVNWEAVQNVVEYKYLGCIINEYAEV